MLTANTLASAIATLDSPAPKRRRKAKKSRKGHSTKRVRAAKKAARTRARNASKRSAAARKAARTRKRRGH